MWWSASGHQLPAVESTCMLMMYMMKEYWNTGTDGNQAVAGKQDSGVKKLSMYTLKVELDQGKLSVPKYKGKQKIKENISLSRCRFPRMEWGGES